MTFEQDARIYCINLRYGDVADIFKEGIKKEEKVPVAWSSGISVMIGCDAKLAQKTKFVSSSVEFLCLQH